MYKQKFAILFIAFAGLCVLKSCYASIPSETDALVKVLVEAGLHAQTIHRKEPTVVVSLNPITTTDAAAIEATHVSKRPPDVAVMVLVGQTLPEPPDINLDHAFIGVGPWILVGDDAVVRRIVRALE